jgi:transcriptional regulator with XRE-family HTH domain
MLLYNMILSLKTPAEVLFDIRFFIKEARLSLNLTQEQLADQANVSLAVLRKFERTGKISLESFVKLTFVLGLNDKLLEALRIQPKSHASLSDILAQTLQPKRQRASSGKSKYA